MTTPSASDAGHQAMVDRMARLGVLAGPRLEAAFRAVPRAWFLPEADPVGVLDEHRAVPTRLGAFGQATSSSSSPVIMSLMLAALDVGPGQRVLEVGAGTGYNAALLAELVGETGSVTTIDIDPGVVADARRNLGAAGRAHVDVRCGDGWEGVDDRAPFDRIIVTASVGDLSPTWLAQLTDPGVLVAPIWLTDGYEVAAGFRRSGRRLHAGDAVPCMFMGLRGAREAQARAHGSGGRAVRRWVGGRIHRPLSVEALPSGDSMAAPSGEDTLVLRRPAYTFVVSAGTLA